MKLVELVAAPATSAQALDFARTVTEAAGKQVVTCADCPGFIVNRCARPYYGEALAMLEEGISAQTIDAAMSAAGYRLGPFALIDLIGADINLAATEGLSAAIDNHPRYHVFQALRDQVSRGDLGRKTGRGFVTGHPEEHPTPDDAIALRIEATLANEAASLLDEGGVTAEAIDTALRLGLNFPRGPFDSARRHGISRIQAELRRLSALEPDHLKGRYAISPALEDMT
jgi:3-hydroxybutyryl-CoA dehydrogenase